MTLDTLIMLVGAFIAALPLGGLPRDWQDTFVFLAGVVVIALGIVVLGIVAFVFWIVCMWKAFQGEMYHAPFVGGLADKQLAKMK